MTSANPATPLTRAEFRNSCTSVLQGLDCLFKQGAILDEALGGALQELGTVTMNLMPEIDSNKEYYVDGPLVRYLTAEVSKGRAIIQEIKRTCSQKSAAVNGAEYIQRHHEQHLAEIQSVLEALNAFYQHRLFNSDTANVGQQVEDRMDPTRVPMPHHGRVSMNRSGTIPPPVTASSMKHNPQTPQNTPTQNGLGPGRSQAPISAPANLEDTTVKRGGLDYGNPSIPGVFEHIHDVQTAGRQPHSDSWPKHREVPPNVFENIRPPLVYPGLRDVHNYRNLPQFTGVNLPVPSLPSGELGHRAPHTEHWGHTNKYVY